MTVGELYALLARLVADGAGDDLVVLRPKCADRLPEFYKHPRVWTVTHAFDSSKDDAVLLEFDWVEGRRR